MCLKRVLPLPEDLVKEAEGRHAALGRPMAVTRFVVTDTFHQA